MTRLKQNLHMATRIIDCFVVIFSVLACLLEILAYKNSQASFLQSRIWLGWSVYFLIFSVVIILRTLILDIKSRKLWGIAVLVIVTGLTSFQIDQFPINISGESTQQVVAGLTNFKIHDLGYTQTAFLSNPARQYILMAIPSLIFGKTVTAYRLGYLFIFLLGIYLFYSGIRFYFREHRYSIEIGSIAVASILAFPVVPLLLRNFEQNTSPFSFTLAALGTLLIAVKKKCTLYSGVGMDSRNASYNVYPSFG